MAQRSKTFCINSIDYYSKISLNIEKSFMKLTSELQAKIADLLKNRKNNEIIIPLPDTRFSDVSIYIGKQPLTVVAIYDEDKNIFIGKDQ